MDRRVSPEKGDIESPNKTSSLLSVGESPHSLSPEDHATEKRYVWKLDLIVLPLLGMLNDAIKALIFKLIHYSV